MTKRYTVTTGFNGCVLKLSEGYGSDGDASEHEFWASESSGYVYEVTTSPGTSGRQVCESLFGLGSTMMSSKQSLPAAIRRLARRHCDAIDRDARAY
jgi:hypothetical protein